MREATRIKVEVDVLGEMCKYCNWLEIVEVDDTIRCCDHLEMCDDIKRAYERWRKENEKE